MPEIPGPLGRILNVGGYVGNEPVSQRGWTTYVGMVRLNGDGGYLGDSRVVDDRAGRTWVGDQPVTRWGGSDWVGPNRVSR
jgi:hypothetical protein